MMTYFVKAGSRGYGCARTLLFGCTLPLAEVAITFQCYRTFLGRQNGSDKWKIRCYVCKLHPTVYFLLWLIIIALKACWINSGANVSSACDEVSSLLLAIDELCCVYY